MSLSIAFASLPTKTFATSIYKDPTREIGLKSLILIGESTLEIRVMKYDEKLFGRFAVIKN
jgi:hypothetical protein